MFSLPQSHPALPGGHHFGGTNAEHWPGSLLHERTGENEFIQLHNHLIDLCGWGLHLGLLSLDGLVSPRKETSVKRAEKLGFIED
jgi:hypothetical protein